MKNCHDQILKQEILSEKMSEQNSEIENFHDRLFNCYVCWQKLDLIFVTIFFKTISTFIKTHENCKTVHEGGKDFKCKSCKKSFTQADSLREHIKNIPKGHKYSHWLHLIIWEKHIKMIY